MKRVIDDNFSWKRIGALYRYCSPYLNRQMAIYALAIIFLTVLTLLPLGDAGQFIIFTLVWGIIPYMAQLAPVIFAKGGDSRIIDRLVPATPVEKYIFYLSYIFIVIPAICYIIPYLASWIYTQVPALQTETVLPLVKLRFSMPSSVIVINALGSAVTSITCFFVVMYSRSNRVLKGIVSVFAVQIIIGLISGIYAFIRGLQDADRLIAAKSQTPADPNAIVNEMMSEMGWSSPYIIAGITILAIYLALMLWMSYRAVNSRDL